MSFRCSVDCELRGESMVGTASTVPSYLLIEHPGPWGDVALRDARMREGVARELRRRSRESRVRALLIRRPAGRSRDSAGVRVFAGVTHHRRSSLVTTQLGSVEDVLDLDFEALGAGRVPDLPAHTGPVLAVCTHGRHDACCAERGRPLAAALAAHHPEATWEVSHVGGDRFAGNLLALPWGLYFGRLDPENGPAVVAALLAGELDLDHLRGRSGLAMPLQAAELALRRHLGVRRVDAVRVRSRTVHDGLTDAVLEVDDPDGAAGAEGTGGVTAWSVRVRSGLTDDVARLTCATPLLRQAAEHDVVSIAAVQAQAS